MSRQLHIKLVPTYIMLFVWHLRCVYELKIVNPFWYLWPLPENPTLRVWTIISAYLLISIQYLWATLKSEDRPLVIGIYAFVAMIQLFIHINY